MILPAGMVLGGWSTALGAGAIPPHLPVEEMGAGPSQWMVSEARAVAFGDSTTSHSAQIFPLRCRLWAATVVSS
jgi:hypothetical protein